MKTSELLVNQVSIKRIFNLGNYETLGVEFVATVGEGQDFKEVAYKLDKETEKFMRSREE